MISDLCRRECEVILRSDLSYFAERCFYELNPQTPFFPTGTSTSSPPSSLRYARVRLGG